MARSREFLERFRPSGTPGAAAGMGVPADRVAERAAELEPVFARLEDVEVEMQRIYQAARADAEQRRAAATERARGILATARRQVEAERADAAAHVRRRAEAEAAAVLAAAEADAAALRSRAQQRMPAYVERVMAAVRSELTELLASEEHA